MLEKKRDDIINEEIEQEHNENRDIKIVQMSDDDCKNMEEKLNNPNFFPMDATITLHMVDFVDLTEFNSQKFSPLEINEKRKDYVVNNFEYKLQDVTDFIQNNMQSKGFVLFDVECKAAPFNAKEYIAKAAALQVLKDLKKG